jgi:multifunctional beta-oxidation protein
VKALAKEGSPYNIRVNIVNPAAASRLTQTVMTPELLARLSPEWVVPVVAAMTYKDSQESGSVLDVGAAVASKFRWERSRPVVLTQNPTLTAISAVWGDVSDFSNASYPDDLSDSVALPEGATVVPTVSQKDRFDGKVAVVIGAGTGLGQQCAILLASLGAKVVVNCVSNADAVVKQIKSMGGEAVADSHSSDEGAAIVKTAVDAFGTIHIIINYVRPPFDRSFHEMTDETWAKIYDGITYGPYAITKAAWPHMLNNKYGRIVNTTSNSGLYGQAGQSGYSAGTMAIVGFSRALFREGQKYDIQINAVALSINALTSPERVAPFLAFLSSDSHSSNGGVYEIGPGWISRLRWQRSKGYAFPSDQHLTSKEVYSKWRDIVQYENGADNPDSAEEGMARLLANVGSSTYNSIQKIKAAAKSVKPSMTVLESIEKAKRKDWGSSTYKFGSKDVILYSKSFLMRVFRG